MILKTIYEEYGFNIESLLIKEAKRLNLTTKELNVLLILFSISKKRRTFSLNAISKRIDYNQNEIAQILESLLDKEFVKITLEVANTREREVFDLDGTFKKITELLTEDENEKIKQQTQSNVTKTIELFENKLGRILYQQELERIRTWYETYNYDHNKIIDTINNFEKGLSIVNVEKILNMNLSPKTELDQKTEQALERIFKKL